MLKLTSGLFFRLILCYCDFKVKKMKLSFSSIFVLILAANLATAGPVASGICYAGCAAVAVACFSAAGFTFGTVPGAQIAAVPALAACNSAFGVCEAACMAAFFAPTP